MLQQQARQLPRAKTAGELGINAFRQTFNTGRKTAAAGQTRQTQRVTTPDRFNQTLSKTDIIEIQPQEFTFHDIEVGQIYEAYIHVRNLTRTPRRIRISQPKTSRFRVDYDMQGALAAGLAMRLVLQFETQVVDDYHDTIQIKSEDNFTFEIPIHALKPQPIIVFPTALNLGFAKIQTEKTGEVLFSNTGKQPGKITLKTDVKTLKIEPSTINLPPGASATVKFTYISNQPQVFRNQVQVIQNWCSIIKLLDVSCTIVEYSIFFLDSSLAQTTLLDFSDQVLGYLKSYNGFLVNNTPVSQSWKVIIRKGFHTSLNSGGQMQTPSEVGSEWLEKVVRCHPEKGMLEPYAQTPIKIDCRGHVTEEDIQKAANFAFKNYQATPPPPQEFQYSLFFEFPNEEALALQIQGKQLLPQMKLNKQHLKFGDCNVHDTRDATLIIENLHKDQLIDIGWTKVPQFSVFPEKLVIPAGVKKEVCVTFNPKNVGKVTQMIEMLAIEGQFHVPIQLQGHASYNQDRRPVTRGPEALPKDFQNPRNFIDDSHLEYLEQQRKNIQSENLNRKLPKVTTEAVIENWFKDESETTGSNQQPMISEWEQERQNEKLQVYYKTKENQLKYTQYLRGERQSRLSKKREQILQMRVEQMKERMKEMNDGNQAASKAQLSDEEEKDPKVTAPIDIEFQIGMMQTGIMEPELNLPEAADGLFVTRPIDKYEPFSTAVNEKGIFNPDPLQPMKRKFPPQPQTHRDIRDINMELKGEELKKIQAGPVQIDFGKVFVKSKITRTFHIKNDLRNAISAQMIIDREELQSTYQLPQIIPSSETAKFEIGLQSNILGSFSQTIKYIINGRHSFEFSVCAQIEPVTLELSKNNFKFQFSDDSLNLETNESIRLTNTGNANANFRWVISEQKVFFVNISEGTVPAQKYLDISITYKPSNLQIKDDRQFLTKDPNSKSSLSTNLNNQQRVDEDKLVLKITDGIEQTIKVQGMVNDAKCILKHSVVDMKELLVCKPEVRFFTIRNTSRVPAVFKILNERLPAACDILPVTGKINPDESKDITVKYQAREETDVKTDIQILIRGGRVLKIPFQVKTIIPAVEILQDQFDFGRLTTLGNEGQLKLSIQNTSQIGAELILDLRGERENPDAPDGIECLQVIETGDSDESVLRSVHSEGSEKGGNTGRNQEQRDPDDAESANMSGSSSGGEEDDLEKTKPKKFILQVQPQAKLEFLMKFAPKDVKTYNFELPIYLSRYGKLPGLTRMVTCRGLKPKFLMDPSTVEFARKIITSVEKCFPVSCEVILSNPEKRSVAWRLDSTVLNADRVFVVTPNEGRIDPGQTLRLKAQFNPLQAGDFQKAVPVFIDDPDQAPDKPYLELVLKGSAAKPKLLFDRREVLLPVVPLNIESKCTFRIINDGYENLNLRYKVFGEEGGIMIKLKFNEGQNLGITKKRLRIDAMFSSVKPVSFTTRIEFYDESGKTYTLPISGTVICLFFLFLKSDNCLLTNFSYLQRLQGEFRFTFADEENQKGAIMLIDADSDVASEIGSQGKNRKHAPSVISSKTHSSHISGRSTKSALGYSPIPQDLMQLNKQYVTKWMNFYVLSSSLHSFPESVIESDGAQIFELITFLSGRTTYAFQINSEKHMKKQERVQSLIKQYDELIRLLKSEGALLNHIRPYHLLSLQDLNFSLKSLSKEDSEQVHPSTLKVNQQRFNYISADSWCMLFYQIVKIYYLSRINPKYFRTIPGMPLGERSNLPEYYISGSNVYSAQEGVLMRWLEVHHELLVSGQLNQTSQQQQITTPQPTNRILSFDKDLRDCWHLSALIQSYVGPNATKYFNGMKNKCILDEDYTFNAQKVFKALQEINLQTPFEVANFSKPSAREMILLLLHLFNVLQNYIPRGTAVIFQCVLGKDTYRILELNNPTSKPISYWVKYEGAPDFILEGEDCIKIESKQTYKYKIRFVSRVSQPVQGRVTFTNKRESNINAATLVFDLKSHIIGRISESTEMVSTALYEQKEFSIQIVNKFTNQDVGNFQIKLVHEPYVRPEIPTKKKKLYQQPKKPDAEVFPAFFCSNDYIRLKKSQTTQLPMKFIPLIMETHKCLIIFTDPQCGEFQHEVIGQVELPEQMIEYKPPNLYVEQTLVHEYHMNMRNEPMLRARKTIEQVVKEGKGKQKLLQFPGGQPEQIVFDLELQNAHNFITVPKQFTLNDHHRQKINKAERDKQEQTKIAEELKGTNQTALTNINKVDQTKKVDSSQFSTAEGTIAQAGSNKLPITFAFKHPVKDMVAILTMKNADKTDVRRYKILVNALPKPTKAILEMVCPARESLTQDLPIINPSDKDWSIKVNLSNDQNYYFSLANLAQQTTSQQQQSIQEKEIKTGAYKDLVVKKKSQSILQILFSPKWICEVTAQLTLTNPLTNDIFDYQLRGIGEEPLAEQHIVINCQARRTARREIQILNNSTQPMQYRVETDLINANGLTSFIIQPNKKYNYVLSVTPMLSGQYTGSITFFNESTSEYIWYTVLLETESPKPEKEIELVTQARKPIAFDIDIANPMQDEQATFEVLLVGDNLFGEKYFSVLPGTNSTYEVIYLPLLPGKSKGQIGFIHPKLGEIWYNLLMISEDRQAVRVPILRTELGKVEQYEVLLDNPTGKEIIVNTQITNPANFEVLPEKIILPPFNQTSAYIRYIPSNLDTTQTGEIILSTKEIGKWEFLVFGVGIPPTSYSEKIITVGLNKDHSEVIHFKNPFKDPIQVIITLESNDSEALEVFKLLLKTKKSDGKTTIQGLQTIQIPFSFTPREIRSYICEINVGMNDKIKWKYPLIGHTEAFSSGPLAQFKTKCRIPYIQEFRFNLPGMGFSTQKSTFSFQLKNIASDLLQHITKCFQIKMIKNDLNQGEDELIFEIRFTPMKPFRTTIDMIIQRDIGGVWKFPLGLEASPPDVDDLIVISSPLHKTSSISFKLTNRGKYASDFIAAFTPNSDQEFTVSPKEGKLESFGREGTQFVISFTPLEYGQIKQGKLVISTDEMYWSYNVKGTLPKYVPPLAKEGKVETRLEAEQEEKLKYKPKNFIQQNLTIKKKQSSPKGSLSPTQNKTTISNLNMNFTQKNMRSMNQTQTLSFHQMRESKSVQNTKKIE